MIRNIYRLILVLIISSISGILVAQNLENFALSTSAGLKIQKILVTDSVVIDLEEAFPVFSFELNGKYLQSDDLSASLSGTRFMMSFEESLKVTFASFGGNHPGWRGEITFENEALIQLLYQMFFLSERIRKMFI